MGSTTFETLAPGDNAQAAFRQAVSTAQHERGHGGYTGSIAEKGGDGFIVVAEAPMSRDEAGQLARDLMQRGEGPYCDKWGPCGAIPVWTGERAVEFDVAEGDLDDWRGQPGAAVTALMKQRRLLGRGESVVEVHLRSYRASTRGGPLARRFTDGAAVARVRHPTAPTTREAGVTITHPGPVTWENRHEWEESAKAAARLKANESILDMHAVRTTPVHKVEAGANSKVRPQIRYVVTGSEQHGTWETGFDSQSDARRYAVGNIARARTDAFDVVGITRRADGTPLVAVRRKVTRSTALIHVRILHAPPRPDVAADSWLFFGAAPS